MIEAGVRDQSVMLANSTAQDSVSAGAMLRDAREAAGLHIASLAVAMKIPVKKLEALEADRFDLLLDAVFVRALASSVCRSLKIDATPILAKLPQNVTPKLKSDELGINAPFHASGNLPSFGVAGFLVKPVVLFVASLVIGAVVLWFIPSNREIEEPVASPVLAPSESHFPENAATVTPVVQVDQSVVSAVQVDAVSAAKAADVITPQSVELPKVTDSMSETKPVGSNTSAVTLSARGASWVEVVDAKSNVQLRRTLLAGERAVVSGVAPLSIVIGKVDVIDVDIGGKPFSLLGVAKDNVARFEVK